MEAIFSNLPAIISALGTIITGFFAYNQYTKNKETDIKIERFKKDEEAKSKRRADNSSIVYGVQPHPLGNESFVSIYYEVKRKGVEPMKPHIINLHISDIAKFASDLVKNLFMYITDIDAQVSDKYAKSLLASYGCQSAVIMRMNDNKHDWVGSIFCEFTHQIDIPSEETQKIMNQAASAIQYLLPEYK